MKNIFNITILLLVIALHSCSSSSEQKNKSLDNEPYISEYKNLNLHVLKYLQPGITLDEVKYYISEWTNFKYLGETEGNLNYEWIDENGGEHFVSFGSFTPGLLDYVSYNIKLNNEIGSLVWDYQYELEKELEKTYAYDFDRSFEGEYNSVSEWIYEDYHVVLANGKDYITLTIDYFYAP